MFDQTSDNGKLFKCKFESLDENVLSFSRGLNSKSGLALGYIQVLST